MGLIDIIRGRWLPRGPLAKPDGTQAWTDHADSIATHQLDQVSAQTRPSNLGDSYYQREFHAGGEEQVSLWSAEGEQAARRYVVRARELDQVVTATTSALAEVETDMQDAKADARQAARVLGPHVRRDGFAPYRYIGGWVCLGLGDVAGVSGAAISLGEVPSLAVGQAVSIAFAAVTSGQAGADLKTLRMARQRQRDPQDLSKDEQRYRHLFEGIDAGISIIRIAGWISLTIVLIVAIAVFSLRWSVEGPVSGWAFGALAAATALGSFISTYSYTDEVADLIATTAKRARKAEKRHQRLAGAACLRIKAQADAMAQSIAKEYRLRGEAAARHLDALSWHLQAQNPQVYGHGFPADAQGGVIGRRPRRGNVA